MCILFLAWQQVKEHPLIVISNRDETISRETQPAHFWDVDSEERGLAKEESSLKRGTRTMFAGRDVVRGGTWLGVTRGGKFAAITNYRVIEPEALVANPKSRGWIIRDFLLSKETPLQYLEKLHAEWQHYEGFNVILADISSSQLAYYSNRAMNEADFSVLRREKHRFYIEDGPPLPPRLLPPGVHAMSNHLLGTPWPKLQRGILLLRTALNLTDTSVLKSVNGEPSKADTITNQLGLETSTEGNGDSPAVSGSLPRKISKLTSILEDSIKPSDEDLPDTGVGIETERFLSSICVGPGILRRDPEPYGTVCHTTVIVSNRDAKPSLQSIVEEARSDVSSEESITTVTDDDGESTSGSVRYVMTFIEKNIDRSKLDWSHPSYSVAQFAVVEPTN
eukprot:TRINITY_DN12527_c0_g1_i1.p1 TRINITY_DN12527_c0_g1~~TRINITY_DN12527_c0_g1_i1.p1  ORF type:complete len:393 (-),score=64.40 TRINITY_DN12527_c0_g1_i1:34-1212(-)